uniref:Protein FAR1-RELATED SEQUENCE n=1 Tax=Fagus sylvatica TaxID=28930 RepID=A0A2N9FJV3_FAGSY
MCSCRKFETFGILCCHALKVFDVLDIKIIPGLYLLKRWTREAKNGYVLDRSGRDVQEDVNLDITARYRRLCPRLVRLASRAADFEEAYVLVERAVNELEKQVEDIAKKSSNVNLDNSVAQVSMLGANELVSHGESFENLVENVKGLKKKEGRKGGKRLRNWVEKQPRRKKKIPENMNKGQYTFKENHGSSHIHHHISGSHMEHYPSQGSFANSTPVSHSQASNSAYSSQGPDVGFNHARIPLGDRTNNYFDSENYLGL